MIVLLGLNAFNASVLNPSLDVQEREGQDLTIATNLTQATERSPLPETTRFLQLRSPSKCAKAIATMIRIVPRDSTATSEVVTLWLSLDVWGHPLAPKTIASMLPR